MRAKAQGLNPTEHHSKKLLICNKGQKGQKNYLLRIREQYSYLALKQAHWHYLVSRKKRFRLSCNSIPKLRSSVSQLPKAISITYCLSCDRAVKMDGDRLKQKVMSQPTSVALFLVFLRTRGHSTETGQRHLGKK